MESKRVDEGSFAYVGTELELFSAARNWKLYMASQVKPFIGRNVAEVGAGIGTSTAYLCDGSQARWVCLEPDATLAAVLEGKASEGRLPPVVSVRNCTLARLPHTEKFDTLLYVDVLEHIADDAAEVEQAAERLEPGGRLIVVAPAHQSLYTPFDHAIGHYRRYSRGVLCRLAPGSLTRVRCGYLDCAGLLASLGNKLLLLSAVPTRRQIQVWDRLLVPISRVLDRLLLHAIGKSVLCVWTRE
jgi:SAM-dependent methyltransferase